MRYSPHAAVAHQSTNLQIMANFHELIEGFHNFREEYLLKETEFFEELKHGQNPHTLVIACCDSRVDPAIILGCRPGDLFVVRSVAALVPHADNASKPDAVMAAVEYGVKHLEVDNIVVMGHSNCGGIFGAINHEKIAHEKFISGWVSLANPVIEEMRREEPDVDLVTFVRRCEEGAVLLSIENLLSYDWLEKKVCEGTLHLHALYYDMTAGTLNLWDAHKEDFVESRIAE